MRVLITGMCGFIGHHVAEVLLRETNWELVGLDRIDATSTLHRLQHIVGWQEHQARVKFVWHDLRAPINGMQVAELGQVDVILHLAASTHVDRSIENPMNFVMDNVVGTTNLLDYARQLKSLQLFLYFNTDEVFGPAKPGQSHTVWDRYNSSNPYAAAKAGGAEMANAYANTFNLPLITTNAMNIVGERQHTEKFLPLLIRKILHQEEILLHASPDGTPGSRSYLHAQYVGDVLLRLVEYWKFRDPVFGTRFSIVGDREINNLEMAKMVAGHMGSPFTYKLVDFHSARPGHDLRYSLKPTPIPSVNRPAPEHDFDARLKRTVDWYLQNQHWLVDSRRV